MSIHGGISNFWKPYVATNKRCVTVAYRGNEEGIWGENML